MRVCLVTTYPPAHCGIAAYSRWLVEEMLRLRPELRALVVAEQGAAPVGTRRLQVLPCFHRSGDYVSPVLEAVRRWRPEVVHVQHEYGIFGTDRRFLDLLGGLRELGVRTVVTLHTVHTRESFDYAEVEGGDPEAYQCRIAERCDALVLHLDAPMRRVLERMGVDPHRMVVIPHGTKLMPCLDQREARRRLGLPLEARVLLSFGFVKAVKNELVLIEALPLILQRVPNAYLYIAGCPQFPTTADLEYLCLCQRRARELGVEGHVIQHGGFVDEELVPQVFAAADLCLCVYHEEYRSASGAFHLALGAEKPMILSRIPKFEEEALEHLCDEILVVPTEPRSLAKAAARLLTDARLYAWVRRRVRAYARLTSWTNVARRHLELYEQLVPAVALTAKAV